MKVQIEKIQKIEPFKSFNCIITFEELNEVNKAIADITSLKTSILSIPYLLFVIQDKLKTELKNQNFLINDNSTEKIDLSLKKDDFIKSWKKESRKLSNEEEMK